MDDVGLANVVNAACRDLRWARARHASQNGVDWDRVIKQLNKDIIAANDVLPDDRQVCLNTILSLGCHHPQQEMLPAKW